jgi:hypothetical protein
MKAWLQLISLYSFVLLSAWLFQNATTHDALYVLVFGTIAYFLGKSAGEAHARKHPIKPPKFPEDFNF